MGLCGLWGVEEQGLGVKAKALSEGDLDLDRHGVIVFARIDPPDANRDGYSLSYNLKSQLSYASKNPEVSDGSLTTF
jgi:hypothetical protein